LRRDLVKAGVIYPAKVTRLAPQNAASIAGLMLTTEALAAGIKEEEKMASLGSPSKSPQLTILSLRSRLCLA
jgi:chaperonin GroEL